ncbi:cyclin-dependent kinase-like 2 isoform X2 [Esox lucius]|uniref:cyclin-dependent kinase-like 2 isoform X2 n=1 Tax=Esox lucius TaxID=8010 RepID=UPI00147781EF|nr:cyclin-dependent kinase-like 2 isoform X2 [Esox lucius]
MEMYENLGMVGEGSYGAVMKCRHKECGRIVAVKRFLESEDDKTVKKIVLREIKMLKRLRHENLVNLLEVWKKRRRWYLVFEFVERTVLDDLEQSPSGLDYCRLRRYLYQILRAVSFCHQHNIIHRDIKPENILVSHGGVVKLCDFGFARTMAAPGENYTDYVATRWYRAPELLVGDTKYGKAVDVWAIGCLCVEMLTGEPLFPGDSDIDQLYLIIRCLGNLTPRHKELFYENPVFSGVNLPEVSDREPLGQRYPKLSATTRDLTQTCLQTDPDRRPHCSDLLEHQLFTNDGFHLRFLQELKAKIQRDQKETCCLPRMNKAPKKENGKEQTGKNKDSSRTPVKTSESLSVTKTDTTIQSKHRDLDRTPSESKPRNTTLTDSKLRKMILTDSKPRNTTLTDSKPREMTLTDSKPREMTLTDSKPCETTLTDSKPREMTLTDSKPRETTLTDSKPREMTRTDSKPQEMTLTDSKPQEMTLTDSKPREITLRDSKPRNMNLTVSKPQEMTLTNSKPRGMDKTPTETTTMTTTMTKTVAVKPRPEDLERDAENHVVTVNHGRMTTMSRDKDKKHMNLFSRISQQSLSSPLTGNLKSQMIKEKSVIHERSFLFDLDGVVGKRKPDVLRSEFHFPELKPPLSELRGAEGKPIKACNKEQKNDRPIPSITDIHTTTHNNTHQHTHAPSLNHTPTHTTTHHKMETHHY